MKRWIALFAAMMMVFVLFAGCSTAGKTDTNDDEQKTSAEVSETTAEVSDDVSAETPDTSGAVSTGNPVADSYNAFYDAKYVVINKLTAGLEQDDSMYMPYMTILGVTMADLALIPVAFFGYDEATVQASMAMFSANGVEYTANGNTYTMTYADENGSTTVFTGTYDPATDSMVTTATVDGVESIYLEYYKTSFGYVSQSFFANDDGTGVLYQYSITGEDGVFGYSTVSAKPAALTGSEPATFPQGCDEWYAVTGYTITGETSDGTAINFEYTPTPSDG